MKKIKNTEKARMFTVGNGRGPIIPVTPLSFK